MYPPHGFSSCFGIIRKATTTYQAIALCAGIHKNSTDVVGHNCGRATKFGRLIRSLEDN